MPRPHGLFQVRIGGRNDAHIYGQAAAAPNALKRALLQHAEQFDLGGQANVANFIEKERAVIRQFEAATAGFDRPCEGPAFVAKQLAFEQTFRQGSAVELHKRLLAALTEPVQGARHELFAGATLPAQQDGRPTPCRLGNFLHDRPHTRARANNPVWIVTRGYANTRYFSRLNQGFETLLQSRGLQVQSHIDAGEIEKCQHRLQRWRRLLRTKEDQHAEGLLQATQRHG